MIYFTQNFIHSWMNLVPAFRNNSTSLKVCKKQTMFAKLISALSIGLGLKLITCGVSVARKKSFDSLWATRYVFSIHTIVFRYLKLVKRPT